MRIGDREIGLGHDPYIIAEIGVNHDGDVERAIGLTDCAADAGADAVKLQFFETDRLMSKHAKLAAYQKSAGETDPIEMLRRLELTIEEMARVVERAHERGIHAIVTVFSAELVGVAESLPWDAYKTASPDIVNKPLIDALARTSRPLVLSTGASSMTEVERAVGWVSDHLDRVAILQCVSTYPTPIERAGFGGFLALKDSFDVPIGYSDHTQHPETPRILMPHGCAIFEKHFTHDPTARGPDHSSSLDPGGLAGYVASARRAPDTPDPSFDHAFAPREKLVQDCERDVRAVSRQSVVATTPIRAGATITREMLTTKRPGTGILALELDEMVGAIASRDIEPDVPLVHDDLSTVHA